MMEADDALGQGDACEASREKSTTGTTLTPSVTDGKPARKRKASDQGGRRSRAKVFSAILHDAKVPHGAYRAWHKIYDHCDPTKGDGIAWPGFRAICDGIGCRPESLTNWIETLIKRRWLKLVKRGGGKKRGSHHVYQLLDGHGNQLPFRNAESATENRSTEKAYHSARTDTEIRNGVGRKTVAECTPRGSGGGGGTIKETGGAADMRGRFPLPEFTELQRPLFYDKAEGMLIDCDKVIADIRATAKRVPKFFTASHGEQMSAGTELEPEAAKAIAQWRRRQSEIRQARSA